MKLSGGFDHLDELTIEKKKQPTVKELAEIKQVILSQSLPVTFNDEKVVVTKRITEFFRDNDPISDHDFINEGDQIRYQTKNMGPFIFQDLLKHIQINIPEKATGRFTLLKNDKQTTFLGKIEPGDSLKIVWPVNN